MRTPKTTGAGHLPAPVPDSVPPAPPVATAGTERRQDGAIPLASPLPSAAADHPRSAAARTPVTAPPPGAETGRAASGPQFPAGSPQDTAEGPRTGVSPSAAEARTWTIELPAGLKLLSQNDRLHWSARNRISQGIKKAAWAMAINARIPRLERVEIQGIYDPPDRRRRDGDNLAPVLKAVADGIVAAGRLPDDDSKHVVRSWCEISDRPYPRGRLRVIIREVTATPAPTSIPRPAGHQTTNEEES